MSGNGLNLVTGATGFVGAHVVRKLLTRGERVRVLVRRQSPLRNLEGLEVEVVYGDLSDPPSLGRAMRGAGRLYHVAADYRLWARDPSDIYRSNVGGTRNVLEAARAAGIQKVVYTSTVGALGIPMNGQPGNEETPVSLADMIGHYKRSKFLAEQEARLFAKNGLALVIVNPSTPVGPLDVKPTPTGQMIVDFLAGRMPAYVETGLNLVDVEEVAEGHLLAMEKGRAGERYILGSQNLTLKGILDLLAEVSGHPPVERRIPRTAALILAAVSTGMSFLTGRSPRIPLEGVRMAGKKMFFDSSKAVRELGFSQRPVKGALERAVVWFRENGYVT